MRALAVSLLTFLLAAPALGADGEPRKALTAKGQAIARSIVLKRGDLTAGFVPHKPSEDTRPGGARCGAVDESDLTVTGEADSPDFSRDTIGVGSSASVYKTLGDSNTSWRRAGTAGALRCFADLVRFTAPKASAIEIVSAKRVAFPGVAAKTIAYRVVATLTVGGNRKVRAYFDAVLLRRGTMQAALVVSSLAAPVSLAQEQGLAALLADRMAEAAGPGGPVA